MRGVAISLNRFLRPWLNLIRFGAADRWFALRYRDGGAALLRGLPPLQGDLPAPGTEPVVFCAVDHRYFAKFAGFLTTSLATASDTARLHLHLFGKPDQAIHEIIEELANGLGRGRLTCSFEAWEDARWHGRRPALYFQTVRFVRLLELSERTGLAFLLVDADVLFLGPFASFARLCEGADLAARLAPQHPERGLRLRAAALYVAPTLEAQAFLRHAAKRMLLHLFHWYADRNLDQRSLYLALMANPGLRLVQFPRAVLSRDPAVALLLSGGGRYKRDVLLSAAVQRLPDGADFLGSGLAGEIGIVAGTARSARAALDAAGALTIEPELDLPAGAYDMTITYRATGPGHGWRITDRASGAAVGEGALADSDGDARDISKRFALSGDMACPRVETRFSGQGELTIQRIRLRPAPRYVAASPLPTTAAST